MQTLRTLRYDLNLLIARHTLPETLDRLYMMADEQSKLEEGSRLTFHWDELIEHLEKATQAAVALAQLKEQRGEELWK